MLHVRLDRHQPHPPYYLQILEQIRSEICVGELPAGMQLPSSRQLAIELGVARRTVVIAYEELCVQGYCVSRVGHGTVVANVARLSEIVPTTGATGLPRWLSLEATPDQETSSIIAQSQSNRSQSIISFAPSSAQTDLLPLKSMRQSFQTVMDSASTRFQEYERNNGHPILLEAICQVVLPSRGIQATSDQIFVTNGSLHSSLLLAKLFAPYGGSISYGVPGFLAIPKNFMEQGIQGIACPVDAEGVRIDDAALAARFHYLMPEHHFPQGVTLSPERRTALLEIADRHDALIIEDDYDSEFYFDRHPLPALKASARSERVIYLGTFSKVLFNGFRVGYIVAHPTIVQQLIDLRWRQEGGSSLVLQLWLAELLNSGSVDRHLRRMRVHYRKKRDLIASYLRSDFPNWQWRLPSGGLQFWIELPPEQCAQQVIHKWLEQGIKIFSGLDYYQSDLSKGEEFLILGFGGVTEAQIHEAFARILS
jgi:GntR family transcriptional regulator / MocR family aminotransferase